MRKTRQDWVDAGLSLLREEGQQALTIERLTVDLGVSKGSFYHHFGGLPGYRQALLETWETELTLRPMEEAARESNPTDRRRKLGQAVRKLDNRLDLAVRAWGLRDPFVADFVARVDERRLSYLTELQAGLGRARPEFLATLEYAAFIGLQHLRLKERSSLYEQALQKALGLLAEPQD